MKICCISRGLFLLIIILLVSCEKRPDNVLSDSEMEDVMVDLLLADALEQSSAAGNLPDSVRRRLGESVLKQHGIDRVTLDSTFAWYSRNLDDYYRLYSKVDRRLKKMGKSVNIGNKESQAENNIWELPPYFRFSNMASGDVLTFTLPGESVGKGEELKWKMNLETGSPADIMLGIDYADGTSSYTRREFSGGKVELSVIADTVSPPARVYGFIWAGRRNMPTSVDSISLIRLPYDSVAFDNARYRRKILPPVRNIIKEEKDTIVTEFQSGQEPLESTKVLRQLPN